MLRIGKVLGVGEGERGEGGESRQFFKSSEIIMLTLLPFKLNI